MCGIVAIIGSNSNVENALNKIKHRGLDSTKILNFENVSIGFNRLAINDKTENGTQPFEFGNLIGVFNGEIYNANELRKEFSIETKSNSDTEIILPLFENLGSSIIHHLDGFYSGIIYNKENKQTFLLRDYIGKKPLFFGTSNNDGFVVSELKAVDFIDDFQIVPKGFSELKNGKINLLEKHQSILVSKEALKEMLVEAVRKRIPKNEKQFGVFLSGGLDSSIIASIVAKHAENVIYYTLGNTDDLSYVNLLTKQLNLKIKNVELPKSNELPELIDKVVFHTESYNPSIISNGLATYLLSAEAHKDNLKVVLSGEGADELFCGYTISKNVNEWFEKRTELIENMHFTELRRLDLASMAHTIEIRCPFLDRKVYSISKNCTAEDLISNFQGKQILRKAFKDELPNEIAERNKMSFDVGSGIRKMVVEFLTQNGKTEKKRLKEIWNKHFQNALSDNFYFHSYPTFDKAIEKRGISHKTNELEKIESLLLREFETVPFHNLFMLNDKKIIASEMGGTCSDKVLHFQKILSKNGVSSKLHSAFINGVECHRMLSVEISNQKYFIDVGSGWASTKLFPAFEPIEYSVFGMTFKTELSNDNLLLFHKTNDEFKLMIIIPLHSKDEDKILLDIENRFDNKTVYPFQNSLRFSKVIDNSFYFIKGDKLRIFSSIGIVEKILIETEIENLIKDTFKFNLDGLKINAKLAEIAVIIATKNRPFYLEERSLKSIIAQSLKPNRIIIVDDSDKQDSISKNKIIIENFKNQAPKTSINHIQNHRTKGASGSWNSAIDFLLLQNQSPENTFIAILDDDDDDEWLPDYLKFCFQRAEQKSLDMVACDFYRITNQKEINEAPSKLSTNDFLIGNPGIQGSNIFIRLSCFLEAGCFDENLKSSTDRDLCIRIADLGDVRYERLSVPLMNHFAENDRNRISNPNSETKISGLNQFWLKHSKRMSIEQKEYFKKRAKILFNWESSEITLKNEVVDFKIIENEINFSLLVGVICSSYKIINPLLIQLEKLQHESFIDRVQVFLFENNLSIEDKSEIIQSTNEKPLEIVFITAQMQDEWIKKGFFKNFSRNKNNMFSIAQARTMLQKYVGEVMKKNTDTITWILDEDMQITQSTLQGLKILPKLKNSDIDIVIGKSEHSSPNPPINGVRIQLVDFWQNLCWLLNQKSNEILPDISNENDFLIKKYPDYYYDLSRKHSGHLEHPFWIKPNSENETVEEAIERLCKDVIEIFGGTPLTRPLTTVYSENILDSVKDSVNRGGITFIFNAEALTDTPNLNIEINGTDVRRSDMIWAIINKHYRKMIIKAVNIPIFHAGKEISNATIFDIDKLREEILGSILYAGLTDFLKMKPKHSLNFTETEILEITQNIEQHLHQRMVLLQQTFYRARGISKSIKNLEIYTQNDKLNKLTETIEQVFNEENFKLIEQNVNTFSFLSLSNFLNSMRKQSDNFKEITIL
ncbi:MAG: glycosyltransferase [Bacteroidia bacterium]|nr:glycosyltransferase [Bacteroidia bacterium]